MHDIPIGIDSVMSSLGSMSALRHSILHPDDADSASEAAVPGQ